jgi:hypothetical protein
MRIDSSDVKVIFDFSPANYFLVRDLADKQWSLNYRIDRSEKGKDDDIGLPRIYLTDIEAEQCKKAGFSYIEL